MEYERRILEMYIDEHVQKEKDLQFVREFLQARIDDNVRSYDLSSKNMAGRWIKVKDQLEMAVNLEKSLKHWVARGSYEMSDLDLTDLVNEHLKQ